MMGRIVRHLSDGEHEHQVKNSSTNVAPWSSGEAIEWVVTRTLLQTNTYAVGTPAREILSARSAFEVRRLTATSDTVDVHVVTVQHAFTLKPFPNLLCDSNRGRVVRLNPTDDVIGLDVFPHPLKRPI